MMEKSQSPLLNDDVKSLGRGSHRVGNSLRFKLPVGIALLHPEL
jgi:hypothetical protein